MLLVTDAGEQPLTAVTAAGFPAGKADGHCLVNRSAAAAVYLEVGDRRAEDEARYPEDDIDRRNTPAGRTYCHKDGSAY